jgi:hypothetical protein
VTFGPDRCKRLCGAAYGHLATYDGEQFHRVAVKGEPRVVEYVRRRGPFQARPDGTLGRIVRGENVVYVEDILQSEGYRANPHMREIVDIGGHRTALSVALRKEGILFGTIGIWWQEVRPLSDKQIALLQNFAAQAVIAMENARLLTETREALEQQTATAEVLQVINSSPGNLAPVFDEMLEKAMQLCEVAFGSLATFDGEAFHTVANRGISAEYADFLTRPVRPAPGNAAFRLVQGEDNPGIGRADLRLQHTEGVGRAAGLVGMAFVEPVAIGRVGEPDAAVQMRHDVVWRVEGLPLEIIGDGAVRAEAEL